MRDPVIEPLHELVDRRQGDDPPEDPPRGQPQADRRHDAEQPVAADDETEQVGVARSADLADIARGIDQRERFDVGADRTLGQAAPVDVGGQRAAEREMVGAGLLLADAPGARVVDVLRLESEEAVDQLGPLDAGLGIDDPGLRVERDDPVHRAHVEVDGVGTELLAAHRVARPRDADATSLGGGRADRCDHVGDRPGPDDPRDGRRVERRVRVVEDHGFA